LLGLFRTPKTLVLQLCVDIVVNVASVSGSLLLAVRFQGIGRWSLGGIVFLSAYSLLVSSLVGCLFGQNLASASRRIARGQLDHWLLTPRTLVGQFLSEGFNPLGQPIVLPSAVVAFVVTGLRVVHDVPWWWPLAAILSVASSVMVVVGFQIGVGAAAFWDPYAGEELSPAANRLTVGLASYPLDGISGGYAILVHAVPVSAVAWLPAGALLQRTMTWRLLAAPSTAVVVSALAGLVFWIGLNRYESGSSTRYSASGFRR
jgi:ABC-type uncharacterized transport system permease subunit